MVTKIENTYIRCSPLETAVGWIHGLAPATALPRTPSTPREALDDVIRDALVRAPCYVTFSGGRDSSAVLAAATSLARREGHRLPIPVTLRYPDLPETDETHWQERVMRHLHLHDWIRIDVRQDESDLLGDATRDSLQTHGVLWPAALHTAGLTYRHLEPGSLLTGEGGDASLGLRRGTALTALRRGRKPDLSIVGSAAFALLPRPARRALTLRAARSGSAARWLTRRALARHARLVAGDESAEPLRYDAGTWYLQRRRAFTVLSHNQSVHAAAFGIRSTDPLLDARFLAALARAGGAWGYTGRTATMHALFGDVLPKDVLSRNTKASFNHAYRGAGTKRFAAKWDGSGVDPELVDVDRLREVWLSDDPTMASALLLHAAWLATSGAP